ncbi:uncharacterized protein DS421_7g205150 [Arachis hypogaea]|nr:uncharacterized protein DS421_7g205150 [Arachis hypogaea]
MLKKEQKAQLSGLLLEENRVTPAKKSTMTLSENHICLVSILIEVEEVYNFSQDDLLTEDILILDTHAEVFVWIGQSVNPKEKQNAFEIGQVQGNSFQKKVTLLFGIRHAVEEKSNGPSQGGPRQRAEALAVLSNAFNSSSDMTSSMDRLNGLNQGGPRQRAEALTTLNSVFKSSSGTKSSSPKTIGRSQGSQRAATVAALSQVLTAEKKKQSPNSSPVATRSLVVETSTSEEEGGVAEEDREGFALGGSVTMTTEKSVYGAAMGVGVGVEVEGRDGEKEKGFCAATRV